MSMTTPSTDFYFIRSDIDLNTVRPIGTTDLVRVFNDFLITSTSLLNSFCSEFERQIITLETKMDSIDRHLLLLEHKLANVPYSIKLVRCGEETRDENDKPVNFGELVDVNEDEQLEKVDPLKNTIENELEAKDHPIFGKYFRMLKMGVPEAAVKQKMQSEGVDPEILSNKEWTVYN